MSVQAKKNIMMQLQADLSEYLTAADLESVCQRISLSLDEYSIEERVLYGASSYEDCLQAFFEAKAIEGRSEKTLEQYRYILTRMLSSINLPTERITVFHLRSYLSNEKERGLSDRTLESNRQVFSSYFGWLYKEGLIKSNPCNNLNPIKYEKKVKRPFSEVDLEKIREACGSDRDKAIVSFLLSTGCRVSEICAVDICDLHPTSNECVVHGKGNKQRVVFFNDVTRMLLDRYIATREDDHPALFIGKGSDRLTPSAIRYILKQIEEKADVENIHPHRFRRTLATSLIDHGMQIQEVAEILGHDKLDTTMKYVYINKDNVHNSYRKYA